MHHVSRLGAEDIAKYREMNALFAHAFEDADAYESKPPSDAYVRSWLARPENIALVASAGDKVVGALAGYMLPKFEQERSEVYIYDLAVDQAFRREGIATALIEALQPICKAHRAYVIFVQADYGDDPAIALYEKLGTREDVMHFDIVVREGPRG
ncbi:MAG: AAC(3)-I family aminoglycoside N-acetyltransferase [Polyangiaceae bacterium]